MVKAVHEPIEAGFADALERLLALFGTAPCCLELVGRLLAPYLDTLEPARWTITIVHGIRKLCADTFEETQNDMHSRFIGDMQRVALSPNAGKQYVCASVTKCTPQPLKTFTPRWLTLITIAQILHSYVC